jgi:hypothetical protein
LKLGNDIDNYESGEYLHQPSLRGSDMSDKKIVEQEKKIIKKKLIKKNKVKFDPSQLIDDDCSTYRNPDATTFIEDFQRKWNGEKRNRKVVLSKKKSIIYSKKK